MKFCTVINCMDGRVQMPVIRYLQKRFKVDYVDSITEPGPNLILSENSNDIAVQSIFDKLKISIEKHCSVGVAIVGHYDCAGNPAPENDQMRHIQAAARMLRQQFDNIEVIGLWVDKSLVVREVFQSEKPC